MKYEVPDAGGSWEHRGDTCKVHGDNVPHAKPYKSREPFLCVQCMLTASAIMFEREVLKAREAAGTMSPESPRDEYTPKELERLECLCEVQSDV